MVECGVEDLPIWQQCALLGLSRSTYYYTPLEESPFNLELMRLMDEQYLKTPFYGVGQMTYFLHHDVTNHQKCTTYLHQKCTTVYC